MARKRGGLAGLWDRNKGAIKTVVPMALGAIPGVGLPLAAGARAAMEGFDRPGRGGIGFDLGQGARGALTGTMQGATGAGLAGGIRGAVGAGRAGGGLQEMLTGGLRGAGQGTQDYFSMSRGGGPAAAASSSGPPPSDPPKAPTDVSAPMTFRQALKQPQVLGAALTAGAGMLPSPESEVARERVNLEREQMEEEQRRRQQIAQLLMPFFQQMFPGGIPSGMRG